MKNLFLLFLLAVSPLAQATTDSDEALARIREQTKNQHIYVDEQTLTYMKERELREELERASKRTGIPVEKFLEKPDAPISREEAFAKVAPATAAILKDIDLAKLERERDDSFRWEDVYWGNVGIAVLLVIALLSAPFYMKAIVRYLRSNSETREKIIENSKRLAALVAVCAVVGSFAISSTYEIADTDVPKWVVMTAIWLALVGAVYGVALLSRPAQPQR